MDLRPAPAPRSFFRRALLIVTLIQGILAVVVYLRGFPYFGTHLVSTARLWEAPIAAFHLPGIMALSIVGLCCGFRNGIVLGPKIVAGHIAVTPLGAGLLTLSNWVMWGLLVAVGAAVMISRTRPRRSPDAESITPPGH